MGHNARPSPSVGSMSRSQKWLLVLCVLGAGALGAWWAAHLQSGAQARAALAHGTALTPPRPLSTLALIDESGQPFGEARLRGHWSIVYFGFTSCPMICPTTMAMLKDVARDLAALPAGQQPQVLLITVDPDTDTPEVIGRYVRTFNPAFHGLTGARTALDDAARQFSVAHQRSGAGGSIDHSSTVYVVDPEGALAAVFTSPQTAAGIAADYRRLAGASGG